MKKEYIKPIMECETFTTNEYIATCWYVKCSQEKENHISLCNYDDEKHHINGIDLNDALSKEYNFFHKGVADSDQHITWNQQKENTDSYYHETNIPNYHHKVHFEQNPNAS